MFLVLSLLHNVGVISFRNSLPSMCSPFKSRYMFFISLPMSLLFVCLMANQSQVSPFSLLHISIRSLHNPYPILLQDKVCLYTINVSFEFKKNPLVILLSYRLNTIIYNSIILKMDSLGFKFA